MYFAVDGCVNVVSLTVTFTRLLRTYMVRSNPTTTTEYYIDHLVTPTYAEIRPWYSVVPSDGSNKPNGAWSQNEGAVSDVDGFAKDVLIVEDESYLCELISDVLQAEGHNTRMASNGREALDRIGEHPPQLILLDLMMPVMDGWEFMDALRANPEWHNIPVVIITAIYDTKRTQVNTGAKAVLTKPFDIEEVARTVRVYAD